MGGLSNAARQIARRTPTLDRRRGQVITQPGDPDFSRSVTPGTQLQFPAAAAESRVLDVKTRAINQLNAAQAAGMDVTGPEFEELNQAARQGYLTRKPTLGETMLGWVGAPFETANLFIQDMLDPERNASLGDYANTLWGGIEDKGKFSEETGFRPESFSETMTMFGWAPNDDPGFQPERILRGIADFSGSVLIDPLTYLTGGLAGLGRKAAVATGRSAMSRVTDDLVRMIDDGKGLDKFGNVKKSVIDASDAGDYSKQLARTHQSTMDDMQKIHRKYVDEVARGDADGEIVNDLQRYLGSADEGAFYENYQELAILSRLEKEVLRPLNRRDFLGIDPLALKELPLWSRGGLRLAVPAFSKRFAEIGFEIPHTRGLGRKLVGDPLRDVSAALKKHSDKYTNIADALSSGRKAFDVDRPWLNGLRNGTIEPWQYHIAKPAMDNIRNQAGRQQVTATIAHHSRVLLEQAEIAGVEPEAMWRTVSERMQNVGDDQPLWDEANKLMDAMTGSDVLTETVSVGSPDLDKAIDDVVKYMRDNYDDVHTKMSTLSPSFKEKYIDGYQTHMLTDDGRKIIGRFVSRAANVAHRDWADAAARGEPGLGIMARIMNTVSGGGQAEVSLGSNRFIDRLLGKFQMLQMADDAPILIEESYLSDIWTRNAPTESLFGPNGEVTTDVLQTGYAPVEQMNEWMSAAAKGNADTYDIVLPRKWDGKMLEDNPLTIFDNYYGAMDDTIKQWTMVDAMRMGGLVTRHSTAIDTQDVIELLRANVHRVSQKVDSPVAAAVVPSARKVTIKGKETAVEFILPDGTKFHAGNVAIVGLDSKGNRIVKLNVVDEAGNIVDRHLTPEEIESLGGLKELGRAQEEFMRRSPVGSGVRKNIEDVFPEVGGESAVTAEVKASPEDFIFHGTTARSAKGILKSGFKGGGLAKEAEAAEQFAVSRRTTSGGEDTVLVFRKADLPPFLRDKENVSDAFAGLDPNAIPAIKPVGSYKASEGIGSFVPVGGAATPPPKATSILPGRADLVDGIPRKAVKAMAREGWDPSDYGGTKKLYQTVAGLSSKAFRAMRKLTDDALPGIVDAGERGIIIEGGDNPTIRFLAEPGLTEVEREALFERSLLAIDDAFKNGDLKGQLNHDTLVALAKNAPNDETSDLLHTYFRNKIVKLGDDAREYLGKDPGEFVEITVRADDWLKGVDFFINKYSARMSRKGQLLEGGRGALQLADDNSEFAKDLAGLKSAARDLQERGYDEAVEIMSKVDDVAGVVDLKGYIQPHALGLGGPAMEGMQVQRDIGLWLKNVSKNMSTIYTPEGVAMAKLATRELLRTWRALATVARPAFHIRNAVGAAWMNMTVGVTAQSYRRLGSNAKRWRKALEDGLEDPFSVIDDDLRVTWENMVEQDVLSGFVASEATGRMSIEAKKARLEWLNVLDPDKFVATRVGSRVMESIEDVARAALFIEYFDEGVRGSAIAARDMVHAIHYDYSSLTPLETMFKSFIPFFVWTRRNLPRQLEMMVEKPAMVQRYKHLMQAMNDNFGGTDENGMPTGDQFSAYAAGTDMYVNPNTPFWARIMIDTDLPVNDLLTIPNLNGPEMLDFANNLMGPHIGTLIDINSQREWGGVNSSATLGVILKGLAQLGLFDETLDGDVRIPYWIRTLQETALPFEREVVDPFLGGPADTNRQQRYAIAEDDNPAEAGLKTLISTLARGVGVKFNTPVDVRGTAYRSQQELNRIIEDLRQRGELPPAT